MGLMLTTLLACTVAQVSVGEDTDGLGEADADTDTDTDTDADADTDTDADADADTDARAPFTLAVLPDTQNYVSSYPEIFTEQTAWILENHEAKNIAFVLHEGDVTDDNGDEQWARAEASMSLLDGEVPYILSLGNHDLGPGGNASDRSTDFDTWFPTSRFESEPWYGGQMEGRPGDYYTVFNAGGMDFLIVTLEFGPDDDMLDWAGQVISSHPDHRAIIVTHCYMGSDDSRVGGSHGFSPHNYGLASLGVNDGDEMWEKLVSAHENIFLVLSGHVTGDGAGQLTSTGNAGNTVHQLLANYQQFSEGGTGWLRLMEFVPSENRIDVRTFSPYLWDATGGAEGEEDDPQHHFSLDYDMSM